jgi:hypothetical protein
MGWSMNTPRPLIKAQGIIGVVELPVKRLLFVSSAVPMWDAFTGVDDDDG